MSSWVAWVVVVAVGIALGAVATHFSMRTVRRFTLLIALGLVIAITTFGLNNAAGLGMAAAGAPDLQTAFTRGADAAAGALFAPLWPGHQVPEPGQVGWIIIAIAIALGYRQLESFAFRRQAPVLDTSQLTDEQPSIAVEGDKSLTDGQRHKQLAAELKFRLAAMEMRSPAIMPGGSRTGGLASIAEDSGVAGADLAGAVIRFLGILWPGPRRWLVRVWVEPLAVPLEGEANDGTPAPGGTASGGGGDGRAASGGGGERAPGPARADEAKGTPAATALPGGAGTSSLASGRATASRAATGGAAIGKAVTGKAVTGKAATGDAATSDAAPGGHAASGGALHEETAVSVTADRVPAGHAVSNGAGDPAASADEASAARARMLRADRAWVTRDDSTRVTVELDDPRGGTTVATKTIPAASLDDAASMVAGWVTRQVFGTDPSTPVWCFGAADGRDLGAMLLARQERVHADSREAVEDSRHRQMLWLERIAGANRCAGIVRYELAQLHDLHGWHLGALRLHALNREQYPRFFRGRYRLAMSLEMLANKWFTFGEWPDPETTVEEEAQPEVVLDDALRIMRRSGMLTGKLPRKRVADTGDGRRRLTEELSSLLLASAELELRAIRRQLTLPAVLWATLVRRSERSVWRPHRRLKFRQAFRDGVCVAELLVAVRRALNPMPAGAGDPWPAPRHGHALRVIAALGADASPIRVLLRAPVATEAGKGNGWMSAIGRATLLVRSGWDRVRVLPWLTQTASWQAAYNAACIYAVLAQHYLDNHQADAKAARALAAADETSPEPGKTRAKEEALGREEALGYAMQSLEDDMIMCLRLAIGSPDSEMDRSFDWISSDPDFAQLIQPGGVGAPAGQPQDAGAAPDRYQFTDFRQFLRDCERTDYPWRPSWTEPAAAGAPGVRAPSRTARARRGLSLASLLRTSRARPPAGSRQQGRASRAGG
ncbi:MAG TPA: hypothetical protein VH478_02945 [Trebonia sp.]|nr:hypothetical protein [Trebonia sp.]